MPLFVSPQYKRADVNRAGEILTNESEHLPEEIREAGNIFSNWRASHAYPINTFQATLRTRLKKIDKSAIVAQRLKRAPSILAKLQRFPGMQLARMQDIGGLRAIVNSIRSVRELEKVYRKGGFQHELIRSKDYLDNPKDDGYRGIHLIYCYHNTRAPLYEKLQLELQIRTRLQHAWATAVETIGTYLGQALKSGEGTQEWRDFFTKVSAAFALKERTEIVPGFMGLTEIELHKIVAEAEKKVNAVENLKGLRQITKHIIWSNTTGLGSYYLITKESRQGNIYIQRFSQDRLDEASEAYGEAEKRTDGGHPLDVVLVSANSVVALQKAYPNYFEDTTEFVKEIRKILPRSK